MTPDKIYISPNIENRTWLIGKADTTNIEYIRKDALLEWAKKEIREWSSESNTAQGVKMGLTLFIDKIESL